MCAKYPPRKIWHEKVIGGMGTVNAYIRTETESRDNFEDGLDMFKRNPKEFLWNFVTINET